ncbi:hypothetical protein [Bosea sp. UNC402CLCol]|uniref:hypothetical protein n=1 Tax=Bosea sp. UNC402CLCol TaxID=1510531 RepID=UPI0005718849|nr:hypothetical protein [Bosea sp. UNC402CLCol]
MKFLTEINLLETALALLVVALAVFVARTRIAGDVAGRDRGYTWSRSEIVLACVVVVLALLLSVSEVTQFMTLDEAAFGDVLRNPADRNIVSNWSQGASHTANLIWIPLTRILLAFSAAPATIDASLKAFHWLVGIGIVACLIRNLVALVPWPPGDRLWLALALAGTLLLLPVDNLALKTLNYDAISLFGSITAILLVARAHFEGRSRLFSAGLLVAALAAQEKLNASLILLVLCFVVGVLKGRVAQHRPVGTAALATINAMTLALAVSLASYAIAAISLLGDPALQSLLNTVPLFMELLTVWIYAPLRFVFGIGNELAAPGARFRYAWIAAALTFALLPLAAALTVAAWRQRMVFPHWLPRLSALVFPVGVLLVAICGALGLAFVTPFWAPFVPLDPSVMSIGVMNGVQLHFATFSTAAHRVAAIGFAYGVFVAAFPTVLVVVAGVTALKLAWRPRSAPFFDLLFGIAIVTPGLLALLNTPTFNRYLNLPIVLATLVIVVRGVGVWLPLVHKHRWTSLALPAGLTLIIAEIVPFRPLYAAFRPVTIDYHDADRALAGHLNFSWTGWGEETILAGKFIEKECARQGSLAGVACKDIVVRPAYNSRWFAGSSSLVKQDGGGFFMDDAWSPNPGNYYVLNRQLVAGGLLKTLPTIPPDFVIRYRGYGMAWVYRGDRLKSSGYRFIWGS